MAHAGGLTHLQRIAHFAELYHVRTACHGPTDLSPINLAATLHFQTAVHNFGLQEYMRHPEQAAEVSTSATGWRTECFTSTSDPASVSRSTRSAPPSTRTGGPTYRWPAAATAACTAGEGPTMTRTIDVEVVVDAGAELGESPLWDSAARQLVWVDIIPGVIHRLDVDSGRDDRVHELGSTVGAVATRHDGGFVLARNDGFALLDDDGELTEIGVEGDWSGKRMNDGKCDPTGRFWAGSIVIDKSAPDGALYRLDADLGTRRARALTVSNGLGWSPDATTMITSTVSQAVSTPTGSMRRAAGSRIDASSSKSPSSTANPTG